ncbi:MAG: hypothetical protein AB8G11_00150 [Saprospiraceae bacterium]
MKEIKESVDLKSFESKKLSKETMQNVKGGTKHYDEFLFMLTSHR